MKLISNKLPSHDPIKIHQNLSKTLFSGKNLEY